MSVTQQMMLDGESGWGIPGHLRGIIALFIIPSKVIVSGLTCWLKGQTNGP